MPSFKEIMAGWEDAAESAEKGLKGSFGLKNAKKTFGLEDQPSYEERMKEWDKIGKMAEEGKGAFGDATILKEEKKDGPVTSFQARMMEWNQVHKEAEDKGGLDGAFGRSNDKFKPVTLEDRMETAAILANKAAEAHAAAHKAVLDKVKGQEDAGLAEDDDDEWATPGVTKSKEQEMIAMANEAQALAEKAQQEVVQATIQEAMGKEQMRVQQTLANTQAGFWQGDAVASAQKQVIVVPAMPAMPKPPPVQSGIVRKWNKQKGFGFIT
eukprot:Hpha_TRINITY_DN15133_c5_g2::TRINITY_DN15133_c5_g2_i1::g.126969::m.126969